MSRFMLRTLTLGTAAIMPLAALAQTAPDAGQTIQQIRQQAPNLPARSEGLELAAPKGSKALPGGATMRVEQIAFHGNSVFTDAELNAVLGNATGHAYDLAGLKDLAGKITDYYRAQGYPFAVALIPEQKPSSGTLRIEIVEGRYGAVTIRSDDPRAAQAEGFLAPLTPGAVIESGPLERATLLLDDQPGYKTVPVMRPGSEVGTGDLEVGLVREQRVGGKVYVDNHGNRYTGRSRLGVNLYANSPFMFGDQVTLNSLYTDEDMWYGTLGYNLPLGSSGLRGHASYAHTYYELGKEFGTLNTQGTADIASIGASYPLLRAQKANLTVDLSYQRKWLNDKQGLSGSDDSKSSDSLPLTFNFDRRDTLGGGGITYGALSWTYGVLNLDSGLRATDATTARTDGSFTKANFDVARLQSLPSKFSLFGRFSSQWAGNNLDSSESFGLGGPNGVRAYPVGEGFGDQGWLTQLELRYDLAPFAPYGFYDAGKIHINDDPWTTGTNERSVGGAGLGLRYADGPWSADGSVAWRTHGGVPQSDSNHTRPLFWLTAGYSF